MSRFGAPIVPKAGSASTTNLAGGAAYDRDPRTALASLVLTSMVQDTCYQKAEVQLDELRSLVSQLAESGQLEFAAKAAVYARREHGLRSITHALAGEVAQLRGKYPGQAGHWGKAFFRSIVARPDDMTEIAGYWISRYATGKKKTLPNAMKRGFAEAFAGMSRDSLAKYNGASTRSMTLRQLAHLVHPTGGKQSAIYALRAGKLGAADTHEVALTKAGQSGGDIGEAKAQAWADLFSRGKVRYLAALRNCRNIIEQAPQCVDALCAKLTSLQDIKASKVMPFQFLAAYESVEELPGGDARRVLAAISEGAELALSNVPTLQGSTLVALDCSGSMHTADGSGWGAQISGAGEVFSTTPKHKRPAYIGALFAAQILLKSKDADGMVFSDAAHYVTVNPRSTLLDAMRHLVGQCIPKGTNFNAPFVAANRAYDRIIILSDAQGWMGERCPDLALREYEAKHSVKPHVYSWDLVGSSTSQFPAPRVHALAGISDRTFDLMAALELDRNAMVKAIEGLCWSGATLHQKAHIEPVESS